MASWGPVPAGPLHLDHSLPLKLYSPDTQLTIFTPDLSHPTPLQPLPLSPCTQLSGSEISTVILSLHPLPHPVVHSSTSFLSTSTIPTPAPSKMVLAPRLSPQSQHKPNFTCPHHQMVASAYTPGKAPHQGPPPPLIPPGACLPALELPGQHPPPPRPPLGRQRGTSVSVELELPAPTKPSPRDLTVLARGQVRTQNPGLGAQRGGTLSPAVCERPPLQCTLCDQQPSRPDDHLPALDPL